jgi:FixJ family two-component response regulator
MKEELATVFIVDDDEAVRGSLKLLLRTLSLPAQAYASAQEFLADFDPRHSGCLVLDIRMPGMSGLELQEELNTRGAMLPIIFITGHGDVPMAVEAMQRGAMDFLQKPFRDQDLLDRINRALEKDRVGRELLGNRERIQARVDAARTGGADSRDAGPGEQGHRG